jgi:hypothetical protein
VWLDIVAPDPAERRRVSMSRMDARQRKASALWLRFSQSLASRRHRLSRAIERSTIHRLGSTTKAFGVIRAFDDFDHQVADRIGGAVVEDRSSVGAVGEQLAQERELS